MARIYRPATMGEAHMRVAIITEHGMADLLVHRVSSVTKVSLRTEDNLKIKCGFQVSKQGASYSHLIKDVGCISYLT